MKIDIPPLLVEAFAEWRQQPKWARSPVCQSFMERMARKYGVDLDQRPTPNLRLIKGGEG